MRKRYSLDINKQVRLLERREIRIYRYKMGWIGWMGGVDGWDGGDGRDGWGGQDGGDGQDGGYGWGGQDGGDGWDGMLVGGSCFGLHKCILNEISRRVNSDSARM